MHWPGLWSYIMHCIGLLTALHIALHCRCTVQVQVHSARCTVQVQVQVHGAEERRRLETSSQNISPAPHCTTYCTACCTLHITYYTLHTAHYTLHTAHYTLHTTHYTLHTTHYTLHTTHYTLHTAHCTLVVGGCLLLLLLSLAHGAKELVLDSMSHQHK
jgi:hypothetical protein